ncbi:serine/threonine-protein kinase [Saccharomonospora sp. NPDC046836]|uniref:serine/threonine-protein kinase n=1 Tax=Saccharomonospora sp. NPDC046836 TaxID=3156921 RepID=UPI0033F6622A
MTTTAARPRLLADYDVIELMDEGDEFVLYDAYSHERYCPCVLKTVRPDRLDDAEVVAALELEARLLLSFTHPYWVRAYALHHVPDTGAPVLVLEMLTGPDLEEILDERARRLPAAELVNLGVQLCSAIGYLHDHGYLHLDVSPSNVIADPAGFARVLDLSLTRPIGATCPPGLGTPDYLSPEQARGDRVTEAADSWGIGLTLYEAATGHAPFDTPDAKKGECPQLTRRAEPIRTLRPRLPGPLRELIDACLSPDPADRPAIADMHATLRALAADEPGNSRD